MARCKFLYCIVLYCNALTDVDQTWSAWAKGDSLEVINLWCSSAAGCRSTMTFPLLLTLTSRLFTTGGATALLSNNAAAVTKTMQQPWRSLSFWAESSFIALTAQKEAVILCAAGHSISGSTVAHTFIMQSRDYAIRIHWNSENHSNLYSWNFIASNPFAVLRTPFRRLAWQNLFQPLDFYAALCRWAAWSGAVHRCLIKQSFFYEMENRQEENGTS